MDMREQMTPEACERIYQNALLLIEGKLYAEAAEEFARIPGYKDATERQEACLELEETERKDRIYAEADKAAGNENVKSQEKAIRIFKTIPGWRDADERAERASRRIEEILVKEREDRKEAIRVAKEETLVKQKRRKRLIRAAVIVAASAAVCLLGVFLFRKVVSPALKYHQAIKMIEAGETDEAYRILHELNFMDSSTQVYQLAKERLSGAEIGSVVTFGCYPQGRKTSSEKDGIEWIVLDRDGSKLLLISKDALDSIPYQGRNMSQVFGSWKTSLVREWLNNTFLQEAFDKGESRLLVRTTTEEDSDTYKSVFGSTFSTDSVFLLSKSEAQRYFPSNEARKCLPTRRAIDDGAYLSSIGGTCYWWLRTTVEYADQSLEGQPMEAITRAAVVNTAGNVVEIGHYMSNIQYTVRPVIWVDTEAPEELNFTKQ